jgi:hypothetical protein
MSAQVARRSMMVLAACLPLAGPAGAQSAASLLDAYGRSVALLNFMTSYVAESLLACAEKNVLAEEQAEARFKAYRERNAALLERADTWMQEAEKRLRSQGEGHAALERADEAGMSATAAALARVRTEMEKVRDVRALCAGKVEGIESGRYDLLLNAEFVGLLNTKP